MTSDPGRLSSRWFIGVTVVLSVAAGVAWWMIAEGDDSRTATPSPGSTARPTSASPAPRESANSQERALLAVMGRLNQLEDRLTAIESSPSAPEASKCEGGDRTLGDDSEQPGGEADLTDGANQAQSLDATARDGPGVPPNPEQETAQALAAVRRTRAWYESQLDSESPDRTWGWQAERAISAAASMEGLGGGSLARLRCGSTLCGMSLHFESADARERFFAGFRFAPGIEKMGPFFMVSEGWDDTEVEVYVAREGRELPAESPTP